MSLNGRFWVSPEACRRHALYTGPYSGDEFAAEVLGKPTAEKAETDEMAKQGFTNAPSEGLGGVLVKGKIGRLALVSLSDIARLSCRKDQGEVDELRTNAARRYIFALAALAALAEAYPRSTGSHRLRSGCELVRKSAHVVDLRGGDSACADAAALIKLYADRDMLVAVAADAKHTLGIPDQAGPFTVSKESLKVELGVATASNPAQATAGAQEATGSKGLRKAPKKSR